MLAFIHKLQSQTTNTENPSSNKTTIDSEPPGCEPDSEDVEMVVQIIRIQRKILI